MEQGGTLGPDGAGKTTLFPLLSAVLVYKSTGVRFKGENSTGLSPYTICNMEVARTYQSVKFFPDVPARGKFGQKSNELSMEIDRCFEYPPSYLYLEI